MEYEHEGMEEYGGRVLWGRIAFFAGTLLIMFFMGRCTAVGGVPQADVDKLENQVTQLSDERTRLTDQLAAAQANAKNPLTDERESEDKRGTATTDDDTRKAAPAVKTYTVKSGDTLNKIAAKFYGESSTKRTQAISKENKLNGRLEEDQKLIIPADPEKDA